MARSEISQGSCISNACEHRVSHDASVRKRSSRAWWMLRDDFGFLDLNIYQAPDSDARFLHFHMFLTRWSCTTTIGLLELNIRVRLKVTYVWRKIQEAQSNYLLRTTRLLMRLDTPLHGNNARGAKYAVYYVSVVTHTVFENIKWLHSRCARIKKALSLPLLVYSRHLFS